MSISYEDGMIHVGSYTEAPPASWRSQAADVYEVPTDYRESGYFIGYHTHGKPKEIPASRTYTYLGSVDVPADEGALLERAKRDSVGRLNEDYAEAIATLEADYPPSERESWHVQVQEANALLSDAEAVTPWIDAAAGSRGCTREDLAGMITEQDSQYRFMHGTLTGYRQGLRDAIRDAKDFDALQAVQWDSSMLEAYAEPA